ncbi:hypothetical protein BZG35_05660 [Brevundimonas sp. LM2]|uniref:acyltransferase family protein n=1 Tax=Brevundimonas sp. LM2 TaxID=1938605 RepID=UPI000983F42F|nr:acyltransferase [Brevundimonas sp. LM2]AQR61194.1 hypothetical protein BZG35_05660 [Brevundimonas sp. LM2]
MTSARLTPASTKLLNIQGLRAVAVLLVVIYHMRLMTPLNLSGSFEFGQGGVDIFFVVSGFIMAWIIRSASEADPVTFATRRLIRIVPLYWLLTLLLFFAAQKVPILLSNGVPTLDMLWQSLLFIPYRAPDGEIQPLVYMGWTLSYEMFFYLLITVVLILKVRARLAVVASVLVLLVVIGLITRPTQAIAFVITDPRLLEFVAGMGICAWITGRPPIDWARPRLRWPVAALLGASLAMMIASDALWPSAPYVLQWGVPAVIIVACACWLERWGVRADWPWLLVIGDASYAIYLSHPFVVKAAEKVIERVGNMPLAAQIVANVGVLVMVGLIGVLIHLWVEKPLLRWLHQRVRFKRPDPAPAAGANP